MSRVDPATDQGADRLQLPRDAGRRQSLISTLVERVGGSHSSSLGIDLSSARPEEIFKWLVASLLLSSNANGAAATAAYRNLERAGLLSPPVLLATHQGRLAKALDQPGRARHSRKTALGLQGVAWSLDRQYQGDLNRLHFFAKSQRDLRRRLRGLGAAVTPTTVTLFLRDLRGLWDKAEPPLTRDALLASENLELVHSGSAASALEELSQVWEEGEAAGGFRDLEAALSKLGKQYCRGRKCQACPVREECRDGGGEDKGQTGRRRLP